MYTEADYQEACRHARDYFLSPVISELDTLGVEEFISLRKPSLSAGMGLSVKIGNPFSLSSLVLLVVIEKGVSRDSLVKSLEEEFNTFSPVALLSNLYSRYYDLVVSRDTNYYRDNGGFSEFSLTSECWRDIFISVFISGNPPTRIPALEQFLSSFRKDICSLYVKALNNIYEPSVFLSWYTLSISKEVFYSLRIDRLSLPGFKLILDKKTWLGFLRMDLENLYSDIWVYEYKNLFYREVFSSALRQNLLSFYIFLFLSVNSIEHTKYNFRLKGVDYILDLSSYNEKEIILNTSPTIDAIDIPWKDIIAKLKVFS